MKKYLLLFLLSLLVMIGNAQKSYIRGVLSSASSSPGVQFFSFRTDKNISLSDLQSVCSELNLHLVEQYTTKEYVYGTYKRVLSACKVQRYSEYAEQLEKERIQKERQAQLDREADENMKGIVNWINREYIPNVVKATGEMINDAKNYSDRVATSSDCAITSNSSNKTIDIKKAQHNSVDIGTSGLTVYLDIYRFGLGIFQSAAKKYASLSNSEKVITSFSENNKNSLEASPFEPNMTVSFTYTIDNDIYSFSFTFKKGGVYYITVNQ